MKLMSTTPDPTNAEIALLFDELADLYELDGAIVHRVLAYRTAAKAIREAPKSIATLTRAGTVTELPGIGKTLEEKLSALLHDGEIPALTKLRGKFPAGLVAMTRLPGLGPKRARKLFDELKISSIEELKQAAETQRLRGVKGFGEKFEQSVLESLAAGYGDAPKERMLLPRALEIGEALVAQLRAHPAAEKVELAGSARRQADTVKDLDIIATASDARALLDAFAASDLLEAGSSPGDNAGRGTTHTGLSIDLRVVEPDQFGNLLQHFSGSRAHNIAIREAAVKRGLHVSEYGILDDSTGETHRCATEHQVYEILGLPWIPPEMREDRGELKLADVPALVTVEDLKGDLHMHTVASDGRGTIREMAQAARDHGLQYIAITDHSASHGFGNDVSPDELRRHIERIHEVNEEFDDLTILAGSEVNILTDGSLDYADDLLAQLDWIVASLHTSFATEPTKRILAAIEHPLVDVIGHPTGRKIGRRPGYPLDLDQVIPKAAETGTFLEINAAPDRRDLDDINARAARDGGVLLTIDSDAHGPEKLELTRWGVATARRAWLTAQDIANTRPWPELDKMRKRNRQT